MNIPIDKLLFKEPVTAGMNLLVIAAMAYTLRSSNENLPPIRVEPEGDYYRIADGRHRVVAAMLAGRKVINAITGQPVR